MRRIVFATRNPHKLREFEELVGTAGYDAVQLDDVAPGRPDVDETGSTFIENAVLKAAAAFVATGLPSVADDSGICVDALSGAPGVYSARWAGNDEANNDRLLAELAGVPDDARGAHYTCALALVAPRQMLSPTAPLESWPGLPDGAVLVAVEGRVDGMIGYTRAGSGGFGYDPLFWLPDLRCTFAELSSDAKHAISHRGRAFRHLVAILSEHAVE